MSNPIGIGSFETLYQTYYPDAELPYLVPSDLPLLNNLLGGNTDGAVSGDVIDMPWMFGTAGGVSQTYATAASYINNAPQAIRPQVRLSQIYKNLSWYDKDKIQSDGVASYGDLMETTVKGTRMEFLSQLDQLAHGNGSGNVASFTYNSASPTQIQLNSVPANLTGDTTGAQLGSPVGQTMFEIGNGLVITSTNPKDGTAPTVAAAGPFVISSVDGVNNILTVNTLAAAGLTSGNVYGIAADGNTMGFNSALLLPSIIGVGAYNPFGGVATSDAFLGVNRSKYNTRLSGTSADVSTGFSIEQGIRRVLTLMKNAGVPSGGIVVHMNPTDMDALDFKLQTQSRYTSTQLGVFFFDAIAISSTLGRVSVVADTHQEQGFFRVYAPGFAQLMYRDGLPHFAKLNTGLDQQWGATYDGREMRMRAYLQVRCTDPRKLGIGKLPNIQ